MTKLRAVAAVVAAILIVPFYCVLGGAISGRVDLSGASDHTITLEAGTKWSVWVPRGCVVVKPDGTKLPCPKDHPEESCLFKGEEETKVTYYIHNKEFGSATVTIVPRPVSQGDQRKLYSCTISSIPGTNTLTLVLDDTAASSTDYGVPVLQPGTYTTPEEYELHLVLDYTDPAHCIIQPESVTYTASSIRFPNGFETGDLKFYLVDESDFKGTADWDTGKFSATLELAVDMPNFRIDDGTEIGAPLIVSGTITGQMTPSPKEFMRVNSTPPPCSYGGSGLEKAYVVNHEVGTVSVVDLGTGKVTTTIPVGSGPYAIAISGNKVYVANYLDSTVSVIDTTTGAVTRTIAVGWGPLAIATSGNRAYVANYYRDNTVSVIDTTTDEVTKTIAVGGGPSNIEISGNKAYVVNGLDGTVSVVDITTDEVTQTITVESHPEDIAICESKAYVSNGLSNTVSVINLLTQTVTATVPVGKNACAIAICGSKVYVANYDDGSISVIDILTNAVTATIPVGNNPSSIAICGNKVYVTNSGDGTVSVLDTATDTVTATFPAGNSPKTIVFGP
jgi:YVTN family beta-propeller protein